MHLLQVLYVRTMYPRAATSSATMYVCMYMPSDSFLPSSMPDNFFQVHEKQRRKTAAAAAAATIEINSAINSPPFFLLIEVSLGLASFLWDHLTFLDQISRITSKLAYHSLYFIARQFCICIGDIYTLLSATVALWCFMMPARPHLPELSHLLCFDTLNLLNARCN